MSGGLPTISNWLGQKLHIGSWVYRGARDGNTSSFRFGMITKINPEKRTVTVDYFAENEYSATSARIGNGHGQRFGILGTGRCGVDTVVRIDVNTFSDDVRWKIHEGKQ